MNCGRSILLAGLVASMVSFPLFAGPPSPRLRESLESGRTFTLRGTIHPRLASAVDEGEAAASLRLPRITVHFTMTDAQQADLERLLHAQQYPSSPQYHQWLTPEQFAGRFGLSESDMEQIMGWLRQKGFTDIRPARGRIFVTMSGTASQVRLAFGTDIHRYRVNRELHYANSTDPVLPRALEGVVSGISGLNDFRPRPRAIRKGSAAVGPRYTSSITGYTFLAPDDFAIIYHVQPLYNAGIDGTGQKIAIAGQTDIQVSDIEAFQAASGLPTKDPQIVLTGLDPGGIPCDPNLNDVPSCGDLEEADLDIEWAGAVARGATIVFVNSLDALGTSAPYAIDQNLAPVLGISYGECEADAESDGSAGNLNPVFQQANAQGITVVAASGDQGAADCDPLNASGVAPIPASDGLAVDFPCSSPYVTCAGGTEFNEDGGTYWSSSNNSRGGSALSYIPEITWNDTAIDGSLSASGGGASELFAKPSWQAGPGVPADGARDVPDIALSSSADNDPFLICSSPDYEGLEACTNGFRDTQTYLDVVGGTSAAAQAFAGIVALINQKTQSRQGNINPALYALAPTAPGAFHDITAGSNIVPCEVGTPDCSSGYLGYSAGSGYDQATGLGSIDIYNLVIGIAALEAQSAQVALNANGEFFAPSGGGGTVNVTETGAGSWTATTSGSWITITSGATGTGSGTVNFTLAANTGAARSGTITINGQTFTVYQEGVSSGLSLAGSMAQIASAGSWDTLITLINAGEAAAEARLNFFSDPAGSPLLLPFAFPQQPALGTILGTTFDSTVFGGTFHANAMLLLDTTGPVDQVGSAQLLTNGAVSGFAVFKATDTGQEAVAPLETGNASSYILAFDNTGGIVTGVAIANVASAAGNVPVVIRDDTGAQIGTGSIPLAAEGHTSFVLTDATKGFPVTAGKRGTVEFNTPAGGQISVLGLRFPPSSVNAFTSVPVLANVTSSGGTMAHLASAGSWKTTITLVNTGTASANAHLHFFGDNGSPLSLPLSFPQSGSPTTASTLDRTLAAGAMLIIESTGPVAQVGSAQLTTDGAVSGFAVFKATDTGQEAVVPLETRNPASFMLAFDNTGGIVTGVAIANVASQAGNVPVVIRDDTGTEIGTGSIALAAEGHKSFVLTDATTGFPVTAGKRGTIEFETPAGGQISVLGLRFPPSNANAFTTIPVMAK